MARETVVKRPVGRPGIKDGERRHVVIRRPVLARIDKVLPEISSFSDRINLLLDEALKARRV
jgi:hypothetical protein